MGDYVDLEECNTRLQLGLGLGLGGYAPTPTPRQEMMRMISKDRPPLAEYHKTNMMMIYDQDEEDRRSTGHTDSEITTSKYGAMRKKLRLTREQTTLLEDSFKRHSTLNPTQKHALAGRLNLKPRQVEVWFQNRRARTKLKQTEVDCELLKKWCESLSEENRKLKKELQELKSSSSPLLMTTHHQIPNTTTMLTMCSSCERKAKGNGQYHLNNEAVAAQK